MAVWSTGVRLYGCTEYSNSRRWWRRKATIGVAWSTEYFFVLRASYGIWRCTGGKGGDITCTGQDRRRRRRKEEKGELSLAYTIDNA